MKEIAVVLYLLLNFLLVIVGIVTGGTVSVAIVRRVGDGWAVVDDITKAINGGIKFAILLPHLDWVPTHWMPLPQLPEAE